MLTKKVVLASALALGISGVTASAFANSEITGINETTTSFSLGSAGSCLASALLPSSDVTLSNEQINSLCDQSNGDCRIGVHAAEDCFGRSELGYLEVLTDEEGAHVVAFVPSVLEQNYNVAVDQSANSFTVTSHETSKLTK